ncbi:MAG TPA: hypothetical protein VGW38_11180, partial [Chloroflexota bacterium]|nr:hypothetical protein [Chloroflexota bacterium]
GILRWLRRLPGVRGIRTSATDVQPTEPAALTVEQLRQVRDVVNERACHIGLGPDKAQLLADAIAGHLAVVPR